MWDQIRPSFGAYEFEARDWSEATAYGSNQVEQSPGSTRFQAEMWADDGRFRRRSSSPGERPWSEDVRTGRNNNSDLEPALGSQSRNLVTTGREGEAEARAQSTPRKRPVSDPANCPQQVQTRSLSVANE